MLQSVGVTSAWRDCAVLLGLKQCLALNLKVRSASTIRVISRDAGNARMVSHLASSRARHRRLSSSDLSPTFLTEAPIPYVVHVDIEIRMADKSLSFLLELNERFLTLLIKNILVQRLAAHRTTTLLSTLQLRAVELRVESGVLFGYVAAELGDTRPSIVMQII